MANLDKYLEQRRAHEKQLAEELAETKLDLEATVESLEELEVIEHGQE